MLFKEFKIKNYHLSENKYADNIALNKVFPLLGYDAKPNNH